MTVKFIDSEGNLHDHAAMMGRDDAGNDIFVTIVGMSGSGGIPKLVAGGKEKYKRVLIRRVCPTVVSGQRLA